MKGYLETVADIAAIATAVVAVVAYAGYQIGRLTQRWRLEKYLEDERRAGRDEGKRTVMHLIAQLGMTEAQVVDAAFRSKKIERKVAVDDKGHASGLLLQYTTGDAAQDRILGRRG